ncbi:MAG: 16S rRNA (adenine(1518)-N(6)/adenine(1519)-N(6))-dimethyltransferase RsmA [Polyangiaceae bacterium]|nr:16S rRNA (adenine(1518)-N(6)/adenine(1519)-N(6))-dimethyltransferase RsmA [Polyangiaceae bacterium]
MSDARTILRGAGLTPKKSFGQNFLVASHVVDAIARACVPDREVGKARVLELGAGLGVLTTALARRAGSVTAVERDRDLVPVLARELETCMMQDKVRVIEGDAQTVDTRALLGSFDADAPRVLCGNLPYQITGRLIERAVHAAGNVERVVFMVQVEVAERLAAKPGSKIYGALSVFTQAAFHVKKLFNVSPGSFHPPPDVTSAVVGLEPIHPRRAEETDTFRALVKSAFGARRKTLRNAWIGVASTEAIAHAAEQSNISLDARGETLSVEEFATMARILERVC